MLRTRLERQIALIALSAFVFNSAGGSALAAAGSGSLSGQITTASGAAMRGASLQAAQLETKTVYSSLETGDRGRFVLADLPAGIYDLAIQTKEGIYTVDTLVSLAPGESKALNLSVNPAVERPRSKDGAAEEPPQGVAKHTSFWKNPLTITLLFLGTATVIGLALDNNQRESRKASQSQP